MTNIAIAADHAGYALKERLAVFLRDSGHQVQDMGTHSPESVDYPDYAVQVAAMVKDGRAETGILICGTGTGMGIAANRFSGIRAAVCHDTTTARLARQHNNANILALGARIIGEEVARDCIAVFLSSRYEGGRHESRLAKIS
ncbi:MAG TPA: ribose 5-phosphate isomerase B [Rhodospirillaceae bacterium]|nr:MAG: ribose 5-phosphate isomerase B [Alphaproteobacteria bacterium GWF2_58_20]HAU28897.1 ribose 5-phosphate isomerase B [Rhodospirillaceae bacterium]